MEQKKLIRRSSLHYAGIADPYRTGAFGVEDNAARLRRYAYILRKLVYLQCGHLAQRANWELRVALGKHLYEDSEAVTVLRGRVLELRQNDRKLQQEPDQRLTLLLEELLHARTDGELLVGLYEVLKPQLQQALSEHIAITQPIVDQPTIRILRHILMDLDEQLAWGREAIETLVDQAGKRPQVAEFAQKMSEFLAAAGGVTGETGSALPVAPRRWRSMGSFSLPQHAVRDRRFPGTIHYRYGAPDHATDPTRQRLTHMMRVRQEEMNVSDVLASVIWQRQDQPWEFTADTTRHLWDEMRHCLFGQAACENEGIDMFDYPQFTGDYDLNVTNLPAAQYVWLTVGLEASFMKKTGKRAEYEFCRDVAKHPLMTQFQDYDWADEVTHAQFGQEWGPDLYDGQPEAARAAAEQAVAEFWTGVQLAAERKMEPIITTDE